MPYEKGEVLPVPSCKGVEMANERVPSISFLAHVAGLCHAISLVVNGHFHATTNCSNCVLEDWHEVPNYLALGGKPVAASGVTCGVCAHPHWPSEMEVSYCRVCEPMDLPLHNHVPIHLSPQVLSEAVLIGYAILEVRDGKRSAEIINFVTVPKD